MPPCMNLLQPCLVAALLAELGSAVTVSRADVPPAVRRITFERGANQGVGSGQLQSKSDELDFVVLARAGQRMRLSLEADGPTRGTVEMPNGDESGEPGEAFFDDVLPADGDYRIRIKESSNGEAWTGRVVLHVRIR